MLLRAVMGPLPSHCSSATASKTTTLLVACKLIPCLRPHTDRAGSEHNIPKSFHIPEQRPAAGDATTGTPGLLLLPSVSPNLHLINLPAIVLAIFLLDYFLTRKKTR